MKISWRKMMTWGLLLAAQAAMAAGNAVEIHVRPEGPIRTLAEGQREARKSKAGVVVHAGTYSLLGGNALFVTGWNRCVAIRGCDIHDTGASAVALVGDPDAVRNPLFGYGRRLSYAQIDKAPGPRTDNYPSDCLVEDCLLRHFGAIEKQATGVELSMAMGITVRHCSIYDGSRAGINVSEGAFGGHVVEFCDVFDTVLETGDHGSFNSWGRDRYWGVADAPAAELPKLALLDAVKPTILRNNRWRCDHGWDVDLDDGSSNYEISNNPDPKREQ